MLIYFLLINTIFWTIMLIDGLIGFRKIKKLENISFIQSNPQISIIIPARNEADSIEQSIRSQFQQSYENIEWIVVNDRSTDETGRIIDELALGDTRMKVIHIKELPQGWLGKNYALYQGYLLANSSYIIFTDADVIYHKDAIYKAISHMVTNHLDHLTIAPNLKAHSFWLRAFVSFFLFGFSFYKRPWRANKKNSKIGIGIGAFNLVKRNAYEKIGTHKALARRPDDDLQLGNLIKKAGLKQEMVTGLTLLSVEWYRTLKEALIGLEKNTFAGLHYRLSMVFVSIIGITLSIIFPFILLFMTYGNTLLLTSITIILILSFYYIVLKNMTTFSPLNMLVFPITAGLFIFSIIRAVFLTLYRGGIVWRETSYSLKSLRKP
ncbi:glycosyltransferase family 2 protein [Bacillus timonensis]|nr:glycosyltransferase family 2 protein [Bacillus timonensis]